MYAWGWNDQGRLGDGTTSSTTVPVVAWPSNVIAVAAGEQHSEALLSAGAPPAEVEATPGKGSLTVTWRSSYTSERWDLARRPRTVPKSAWAEWTPLPGATRSQTFSGLTSGQPYEVIVKNGLYGYRIALGTPR
jgi:hypothetical protein